MRQRFELRLKATQKQGVRRDRRSLFFLFRPLPPSPLRFTVSGNEIVTLRFSPLFRPRIARPFESLSPRQRFELRLKATQKQGVRRDRRSLFFLFRPLPPSPLRFTVSGNEIVTLRFSPLFRPRIARPFESLSPLLLSAALVLRAKVRYND